MAGLCSTATRASLGRVSLRSWSCLARISGVSCWLRPVTLPPGRAKLATSPVFTGSVALTMTIGIVVVARLAASAGAWEEATITSTLLPHEVGGHLGEALGAALGPAVLDDDVLAFDVTQLFQAFRERRGDVCGGRRRRGHQYPDAASLRRRLGIGGDRRQHCSDGHLSDERAPVHHWIISMLPGNRSTGRHSITWSARSSIGRWDREAECLGGLEIDHQLELRRLLDGQVTRLAALEYPVDVGCHAAVQSVLGAAVRHQAAVFHLLGPLIHRGQPVLRGLLDDSLSVAS